jgi:hypothetical protein
MTFGTILALSLKAKGGIGGEETKYHQESKQVHLGHSSFLA